MENERLSGTESKFILSNQLVIGYCKNAVTVIIFNNLYGGNMKKWLSLFLLFVLISCQKGTDPSDPVEQDIPNPKNKYALDVKTKYSEKMSLSSTKNGLIAHLESSNWATVVETGENYSVWIKDLKRVQTSQTVNIQFTFSLNTPAMFTDGDVIKTRSFNLTLQITDDIKPSNGVLIPADVQKWIKNLVARGLDTQIPGVGFLADKLGLIDGVLGWVNNLMSDGETSVQKAEAVLLGLACYNQLKIWLNEIEK